MLKNANGGDGTNNKDSQQIIKLIKDTGFEQFYELAAREGIVCQQPVIVKTVAADGGSATIAFPSDPTYETKIYFTNCTNTKLVSGQKVYLHHNFDNPSQGWLVLNTASYAVGTITDVPSGYSLGVLHIRQIGNIVYFSIYLSSTSAIPKNQEIKIGKISGVSLPPITTVFTGVLSGNFSSTEIPFGTMSFYGKDSTEARIGTIWLMVSSSGSGTVSGGWFNFTYII